MLTRIARWSALKAWASGLRSEPGCVKPRLPSLENLLSFRTGCGSTAPNSNGQRRPPINLRSSTTFPRGAGKQRPCRDAGVGAIAPGFAMLARANRASHIDPPPSSYAIMRRACPYRGENPGPGKDVHGELDHRPGIREQESAHLRPRSNVRVFGRFLGKADEAQDGSKLSLMTINGRAS